MMKIVILQAKIENRIISVHVAGKWRPVRRYDRKGCLPGRKIREEIEAKIWVNMGKPAGGRYQIQF